MLSDWLDAALMTQLSKVTWNTGLLRWVTIEVILGTKDYLKICSFTHQPALKGIQLSKILIDDG